MRTITTPADWYMLEHQIAAEEKKHIPDNEDLKRLRGERSQFLRSVKTGIEDIAGQALPSGCTLMTWTIRDVKDAYDIENLPEEVFWHTRVEVGMTEYTEAVTKEKKRATYFLNGECSIPASKVVHAYIVNKLYRFRSMSTRRANALDYFFDVDNNNILISLPFSRYFYAGTEVVDGVRKPRRVRQRVTQSILGMEVPTVGNYSSIFGHKSGSVKTKSPSKRRTLIFADLKDILAAMNSVLNPARQGEGTKPNRRDPRFYDEDTLGNRTIFNEGRYNTAVYNWIDMVAQVRFFLELHRLSKWFPTFEFDPENMDRGNSFNLHRALENYRVYRANPAAVGTRNGAVRLRTPREVIAWYRNNPDFLAALEEFELCRALVGGMFDVESPYGPYPTHNADYTELDYDDILEYANPNPEEYLIIGDLLLNALWKAAEREQEHTFFEHMMRSTLTREHVMRALTLDHLFFYNYDLTEPDGSEISRIYNPHLVDPAALAAERAAHPGDTIWYIEPEDVWLRRFRELSHNRNQAAQAGHWLRRSNECQYWNMVAEKINLQPGGWWSATFSDALRASAEHVFEGYGTPYEQMFLLDKFGSVCLITQVFDSLIRGNTEAFHHRSKYFDDHTKHKMKIDALTVRKTIARWLNDQHVPPIGIMQYSTISTAAPLFISGPCMTAVQTAMDDPRLLRDVEGIHLQPGKAKRSRNWIQRNITERRTHEIIFDSIEEANAALISWIFWFTHDVPNWDIRFKPYYEEMQAELGIYEEKVSFEEYYDEHYINVLEPYYKSKGKPMPELLAGPLDNIPLNIWEWLFVPRLRNCRPVMVPRCSEVWQCR